MDTVNLKLKPYQADFYLSLKRYPAMVSAIGTGKTMMMLVKIMEYCNKYKNSLALIVRKEYTDLRDSTIKDFSRYFGGARPDSNKEYHMTNGSVIMFRHGAEMNVLKNINLSIFGIEQAEEFETDEIFTFLRDRLRRDNAPYRQGIIIANANGHNWVWKQWINNPGPECDTTQATTFDNVDNLPKDFIADLRRMEVDAPNHYRRFVMNSHEDLETDDGVYTFDMLRKAVDRQFRPVGVPTRVLAVDVARYGNAETAFTLLQTTDVLRCEQIFAENWKRNNLMEIVGKIADLKMEFKPDGIVIDDDGMGGGVTDRCDELGMMVTAFHGGENPRPPGDPTPTVYGNVRTEAAFMLRDLLTSGYIKLIDDPMMIDQLMTLRFQYRSDKKKCLISKERMRADGIVSPDRADALIMAVWLLPRVQRSGITHRLPRYAITDDDDRIGHRLPQYAIHE